MQNGGEDIFLDLFKVFPELLCFNVNGKCWPQNVFFYLMENGSVPEITDHVADCIIRSAPLHDFGKIAIPDAILNKPGKYLPEEYEEMKKHPVLGAAIVERILQNSEDIMLKNIAGNIAHYHHENGTAAVIPKGAKGWRSRLKQGSWRWLTCLTL